MLGKFKTFKPYYKSTIVLAGPVVISQLGHTLVHTADSVIVGHFAGTIPLAAVSLVNAVFMIVMVVGLGIVEMQLQRPTKQATGGIYLVYRHRHARNLLKAVNVEHAGLIENIADADRFRLGDAGACQH